MHYWLVKSEPETYSFHKFLKEKTTDWNGVRNYQARNFLKSMNPNDQVIVYHSVSEKAAVGLARVLSKAAPDLDPKRKGEWVKVKMEAGLPFRKPVSLGQIKNTPELSKIPLIRHSRLSVMPLTKAEFKTILKLGGLN